MKNYGCIFGCFHSKVQTLELNVIGHCEQQISDTNHTILETSMQPQGKSASKYNAIILDCSRIQFIDECGVQCLKEVIDKYRKENVKFLLTNCNGDKYEFLLFYKIKHKIFIEILYLLCGLVSLLDFFKKMSLFTDYFENIIFLTNKDAIQTCV